ncbi:MAG: LEA type 2 family protein [Pseudoxanthomonas suwonensis]|nr:LEA type 2 family protein [Pseudoxanthomonas suwonensis]
MRPIRLPALPFLVTGLIVLLLASCATGPVRRVSEPAVSIQQLTVQANGDWAVALRLQNFSSIPMRFDALTLTLNTGDAQAGQLQARPALDIGPESADVVNVTVQPSSQARLLVADALASGRGINYRLEGSADAVPQDGRSRHFKLERSSSLSPVPGLVGVLR